MSRFADIRVEWRVAEIESTLRGKAESYEVSKVASSVDCLERASRETRSEVDGLRSELQTLQEELRQALQRIEDLEMAQP